MVKKEKVIETVKSCKLFLILLVVVIVMGAINPRFVTISNFTNIFRQIATNAILAAGVCFVILTGGIDISVGATLGFVGAISVTLASGGMNIFAVVAISLAIGIVIGAFNGILVSKFFLQPMIVTLATQSIFRGLTYIFTKGSPIPLKMDGISGQMYKMIGSGSVFGTMFPISLLIVVIVYAFSHYSLDRTTYGRHIYAVGGNESAAKLSGINTVFTKTMAYVASGVMAALAGIIISARVSSAQPNAGEMYEMDAIAAVVIGGTSLRGGEGRVLFCFIGAIIIGMLNNFLNLMGVDSYYQVVVKGVVILVAVMIDAKSAGSR